MFERANTEVLVPDHARKLAEIARTLEESIGPQLATMIHYRASVMNGCTFCLDMDVKKSKIRGDSELKLHHINAWRESNLFSEKERVALEWTEAITFLKPEGITADLYGRALEHFSEKQLAEITFLLGIANTWNRLNVAFRSTPGKLDKAFGLDKAGL